jgi:hypothetical protein
VVRLLASLPVLWVGRVMGRLVGGRPNANGRSTVDGVVDVMDELTSVQTDPGVATGD